MVEKAEELFLVPFYCPQAIFDTQTWQAWTLTYSINASQKGLMTIKPHTLLFHASFSIFKGRECEFCPVFLSLLCCTAPSALYTYRPYSE